MFRTRAFRDIVVVLVLVFGVGSVAMLLAHVSPIDGFAALFDGAFGTKGEVAQTLVEMTSLLFPALGIAIAFLGGVSVPLLPGDPTATTLMLSAVGVAIVAIPELLAKFGSP